MKKKLLCLFVAAMMLLSLLAACNGDTTSSSAPGADTPAPASTGEASTPGGDAPTGGVVKIGFLGLLSGGETYLGVPAKLAMEDYIEEMNANGGLLGNKVELVTYDIARGIEEVVPAATKMVEQDEVIAIIGPTASGPAIAANPVVTEAGVPLVATSATSEKVTVDESGVLQDWMFRVCFIDPYQAEALAGFAVRDLGFKNVAVLTDVTVAYTQGLEEIFIDVFEREGGTIVAREGFNENDVEFRAQLANIAKTEPDALFLSASNYRYGTLVAQQAAEMGMQIPMLLPDAIYAPELLETAGAELEGSYVATGIQDDDPAYADYRAAFAEKHPGEQANMFAYYALDALMAIEYCANQAGSVDPAAIRDGLEQMKDVPVFTGSLTIDPATHNPLDKPVTMMKISDSKFEFYQIYEP